MSTSMTCCLHRCASVIGWIGLKDSVERLHRPPPDADSLALQQRTDPAWRRLMFDELLAQQLALRAAREARADRRAPVRLPLSGSISATAAAPSLPFTLTAAQQRVWAEIERDLARAAADASPVARRRRQRQNGDCRAGRGARDRKRISGRADGADRNPGRAAFPQSRRMAGAAWRTESNGWPGV